ncbi:MAG: hypothetical protein JW828_10705 [Sedimentisphaerales bacterium]|nr:hypothetical protein [Sedimentisphaerales bacterium]
MNFEQQIAEAKRSITRYKKWHKHKWILGVGVAIVVGLTLSISNVSLRGQRNQLADELAALETKADEQINYLSTQLNRAQNEWDQAQRQISILTAQNNELKQMAGKASQLMSDLNETYAELDQAQVRIKNLIVQHESLMQLQKQAESLAQTEQ